MKAVIIKSGQLDTDEYNSLYNKSKISTPFHSLSFLLALDSAIKDIELFFYILKRENRYIAVMPFFKYKKIPFSMKSLVYGCYGGFIYKASDRNDIVVFLKNNKFSLLLSEIVSYKDLQFYDNFSYLYKKELSTWIVSLPSSYDEFLKTIHYKTRNQIKKAYKEGVIVENITNKKDLDNVKKIYNQLINKHSINKPYDLNLFDELFFQSQQGAILFKLAKLDNIVIAYSIFIVGKEDIFYWMNASDDKYLKYNGTNAILDSVIKFAIDNNIKELNMGAVPRDNNNLLHFKKRWGAVNRKYYSYNSKTLYYIGIIKSNNEYKKLSQYGFCNYVFNKIGAVTKKIANFYFDRKIIYKTEVLNKTIEAKFNWSTQTQSIDYLYLKYSLKHFKIKSNDRVLDLGSGKGRILCYLNFYYKNIELFGAEINKEAFLISKDLCKNKKVYIFNIDALENDFIIKNRINKIILFNPFNDKVFAKFIKYLKQNVNYYLEFLYINASNAHISVVESSGTKYKLYKLDKKLLGIDNKINIVGYINA